MISPIILLRYYIIAYKMKYKYTTRFPITIASCHPLEENELSKASIENLRPLLPKGIDLFANHDLLTTAFNAAVVNKFNKNGEGIKTDTAIVHTPLFIHKPTNLEHKSQKIVGHIVGAGFSDYESSALLTEEQVSLTDDPFNISLAAVVYKTANPGFAELLERSTDYDDPMYRSISASWEIGYTNYVLAVGSEDLKACSIIDDPEEIERMEGLLKTNGGNGFTDEGARISRLITGDIYPLGIAFTVNPAADVKGAIVGDPLDSLAEDLNKKVKNKDEISQNTRINVKTGKNTPMDIENQLAELKSLLEKNKFDKEAVASMTSEFADAIEKSNEQWKAELKKVEDEKEAVAAEREKLNASVQELNEKIVEIQKELDTHKAEAAAAEAVDVFNSRMEDLDGTFDLDEDDQAFLAEELKNLDTAEESFASYKSKLEVLWKDKNKEAKAKLEEEIEKRVAERLKSNKSDASSDQALAKAKQKDGEPSNNNADTDENKSLAQQYGEAFAADQKEFVEIS